MSGRTDQPPAHPHSGVGSGAMAGALLALAGHLDLLRAYGTVLPYRDQWRCTAVDILQPWVEGRLGWRNFFTPLNDHWPVLTRALSFLLVRLNGQWNNLLEASVNALILAAVVGFFLALVLPGLRGWTRPAFALLTGALFALPITWENTLWGIQSLVYLQIALTLVYFATVCTARTFSWTWWAGQAVGLVGLLTQHSAVLAQVAVALLLGWRWWRRDGDRRVNAAGFGLALAAILAFATLFPSLHATAALRADSGELALDVFLRQLAWPLPHPAWTLVVYLPWLAWMFERLRARRLDATDAFIFVAGLWVGGQAAAIGYGRGAATYTFVSRYCDFLALGFLLNAACLVRLALAHPPRPARIVLAAFAAFWLIAPLKNFWWESTQSHAGYNLSRRPAENARNLDELRAYFATHDPRVFPPDDGRGLYSYPPALVPLLEQRGFQALLPPESGSPAARRDHGRLGWLPRWLLPHAAVFTGAGLWLLGWSAFAAGPRFSSDVAIENVPPTALSLGVALGAIWLATVGTTLAWPNPGTFGRTERLREAFAPAIAGVEFVELEFERGDGTAHPRVAATGAVETRPADARQFWQGTRLPGSPDFRGILHSQPIAVAARYLVVPFTGYPCANGNGLRWRFYNPATGAETWESYVGPNPGTGWDLWVVDTAKHPGTLASLYLFDGREDAAGWVGAAHPAQTDDVTFAGRWSSLLHTGRTDATHDTLAALALAASLAALGGLLAAARTRRRRPADSF